LEMTSLIEKITTLSMTLALLSLPTFPAMSIAAPLARYHGYSYNWSGYAIVVGGETITTPSGNNKYWGSTVQNPIYSYTVSYVRGEWTVPEVKAGTTGFMADVAVWVGIDGYDSNTVEQIGTDSEYNPSTGGFAYSAWWEMYPKFSHPIKMMDVSAGDHIAAYVQFIPEGGSKVITDRGTFVLSLTDLTAGKTFTIKQGPLRPGFYLRSSAEWIVERPVFSDTHTKQAYFAELPEFGPIIFTGCQATVTAPSGVPIHYDRMCMIAPLPPIYGYGDAYGTSVATYIIAGTDPRIGDLMNGGSITVSWFRYGTEPTIPWSGPTPE
jgi:hypothetical protein